MKRNLYNKLIVFGFIIAFLNLAISPCITALFNNLKSSEKLNNNQNLNGTGENYDLLVIAPEEFIKILQPLANHKTKYGISTKIVDIGRVLDEINQGRDDAEKMKYYIKSAVENWTISYVLLVGGRKDQFLPKERWWLPVRYVQVDIKKSENGREFFLSDLYFADIYDENGNFSSWDNNKNGIFGEWLGNKSLNDVTDLHPDVYIGRLPCRNKFEARIMVNKIISYEKEKCADSWFKRMVVVGGDTAPENDFNDGEVATQRALEYMSDFDHTRLWVSRGTLTGQRDVIREINRGCGFLHFSGHGSTFAWGTHPPKDNETWIYGLDIPHMLLLRNKNRLPICVIGGCHNSMFNVSIYFTKYTEGLPISEPFCWRLTRKIGGGAIATIGDTGYGYGAETKDDPSNGGGIDQLEINFFEEYGVNRPDNLGEVWAKAIDRYLQNYSINDNEHYCNDTAIDVKTIEQWILIGDPSLKIGGYENLQ